ALSLSVLFEPTDGDELAGPRFVIDTLVHHDRGAVGQPPRYTRLLPITADFGQLTLHASFDFNQPHILTWLAGG
ncbi:MAG: hypothetical protein WCJ14_14075, partial [Verrucomicrobiota bacterium]